MKTIELTQGISKKRNVLQATTTALTESCRGIRMLLEECDAQGRVLGQVRDTVANRIIGEAIIYFQAIKNENSQIN
ncbi:hypothetical protein [Kushneria indalinina]|uniref:hypothetical protein n=1 Tax=Kushneria indalinina TaxID=184067 RepID=UPI0011C05BD2|nr:hypothetical protein [Kushneria indalinina]